MIYFHVLYVQIGKVNFAKAMWNWILVVTTVLKAAAGNRGVNTYLISILSCPWGLLSEDDANVNSAINLNFFFSRFLIGIYGKKSIILQLSKCESKTALLCTD